MLKFGDLASFSTTSAATDISTFISTFSSSGRTIVYGMSYGTEVAELPMHLDPPNVIGHILDGIATSSGASGIKVPYVSMW
ncbi:hypothetical protein PI125_g23605 [Phytophthora idaei]|nr:hypothetical protein PI125_g23605 [Phytophthora idaei]